MRKTKQGISLIVLVITIIIMIILAATIIISLENTGIIGAAENAVCKTNIKQAQNLAVLKWSELYIDGERDTEVIKQKIKEEFAKNKLNADDYEISVTTGGVEVSSKAGCTDSSGVEGGNGNTGSDTIPTNWNYAYTYNNTTSTWTAVTTNEGTELQDDIVIRLYNKGKTDVTLPNDGQLVTITIDAHDMIISGIGEVNFSTLPDEKRIKLDGIPVEQLVTNIEVKTGITSIGESSFDHYPLIETVKLPNTLTVIKKSAFDNCNNLKQVTIPSSVKIIEERAFVACNGIEELILPEGVESIGREAFAFCTSLKRVSLPNSIKSLYGEAFSQSESIETVTLPVSLTVIPNATFSSCNAITTINYKGTKEQFEAITIAGDNGSLSTATVVYNYTGN